MAQPSPEKGAAVAQNGFENRRLPNSVTYVPRVSMLDRDNAVTSKDTFRGFYTLFWLCVAILVLNLFMQSWHTTGELLSMTFASLMSRDAMMLALSDAVLVSGTFVTVPCVKILHKYRFRYQGRQIIFLWLWHCVMIGMVIAWTRVRYMMVNGIMSDAYNDMEVAEAKLVKRLAEFYNTDVNEAWARAVRDSSICPAPSPLAAFDDMPQEDPFEVWASRSMQTGSSMERAHKCLPRLHSQIPRARSPMPEHQRLVAALDHEKLSEHPKKSDVGVKSHDVRDPHPFAWHPDPTTKQLAMQIAQLRELLYPDLDQHNNLGPMWPYNVSIANFWDFQLVPSLVYKLQYPRTDRVRPEYVLERTFALFGTFFVLYVVTVNLIMPVTIDEDNDFTSVFLRLGPPMMLCPVHHFLLEHVYVTLIFNWGASKRHAALLTFFFSSILHEIVMIIVSGKVRGYLFMAQMSQYPLILLAQTKFIKNNPTLGNLLFWIGMMIGFPLLNIAYLVF
ncbi:ARE2 [Malassezia furfur]|nr:ARE2 [Malassezia furfur]